MIQIFYILKIEFSFQIDLSDQLLMKKLNLSFNIQKINYLQIKYNQTLTQSMSSTIVATQIINHLITNGKQAIKDKFVNKEKVPFFGGKQAEEVNDVILVQGGYQAQIKKKYSCRGMEKDITPSAICQDSFAKKTVKMMKSNSHHKENKRQQINNSQRKRWCYSQNKCHQSKKTGSKTIRSQMPVESENKFIKLQQNTKNRIIPESVKLRQENKDDLLRQNKRLFILREYQQKKSEEIFHKERKEHNQQMLVLLEEHTNQGQEFKFTYDNFGQLLLFKEQEKPVKLDIPAPRYRFQSEDQINQQISSKTNSRLRRGNSYNKKYIDLSKSINQNQRIKSAKGQAFASSVLKTVNLSRISINGTSKNIDAEQFMKRNDLFNNNHIRQTTSIPYLVTKSGTVYTQVATNQVAASSQVSIQDNGKPATARTRAYSKQKTKFQFFNVGNSGNKTARDYIQKQDEDEQGLNVDAIEVRPTRTSASNKRPFIYSQKRPSTSFQAGRITTINGALAFTLLE